MLRAWTKKAGLELLPRQLLPFSHQPMFSDGDDACDFGKFAGRCSSTAARCSGGCDNKDTRRSSYNNCVGSIHNNPGSRMGVSVGRVAEFDPNSSNAN